MSKRNAATRKGKTLEQKLADLDRKKKQLEIRQQIQTLRNSLKTVK